MFQGWLVQVRQLMQCQQWLNNLNSNHHCEKCRGGCQLGVTNEYCICFVNRLVILTISMDYVSVIISTFIGSRLNCGFMVYRLKDKCHKYIFCRDM